MVIGHIVAPESCKLFALSYENGIVLMQKALFLDENMYFLIKMVPCLWQYEG